MPKFYAGIDLARRRDYSALAIIEICQNPVIGERPLAKVRAAKNYPHVDYYVIFEDVKRLNQRYRFVNLNVDQSGAGEQAIEEFRRAAMNFEGIYFTAKNKNDMIQMLISLLQSKRLQFPKSAFLELKTQIKEQERILSSSENPLYAHPENRHDDQLWALCLALRAARKELAGIRASIVSTLDFRPHVAPNWLRGYEQSYSSEWDRRVTAGGR